MSMRYFKHQNGQIKSEMRNYIREENKHLLKSKENAMSFHWPDTTYTVRCKTKTRTGLEPSG